MSAAFADFLRLKVAAGDASPRTIASYQTEVKQYGQWCEAEGVGLARAGEDDLRACRLGLVEAGYKRGSLATKLAALRRFYEAARWRGLRHSYAIWSLFSGAKLMGISAGPGHASTTTERYAKLVDRMKGKPVRCLWTQPRSLSPCHLVTPSAQPLPPNP
jgi:site-specific recombinase XerD